MSAPDTTSLTDRPNPPSTTLTETRARAVRIENALRVLLREHACGRTPLARDWAMAREAVES